MRNGNALPALDLLVGFEAAARHLSFTKAGEELFLTQSAVSRPIKELEEQLGVELFQRRHRALALTGAGKSFYASAAQVLTTMRAATEQLRTQAGKKGLSVTTTNSFAALWLIPRLAGFTRTHPGVDVRIMAETRGQDLHRAGPRAAAPPGPLRRTVAHSASCGVHAHAPRGRRAHHGRDAGSGSRSRRPRRRRPPRPGAARRLAPRAPAGRARLSGLQPEAPEGQVEAAARAAGSALSLPAAIRRPGGTPSLAALENLARGRAHRRPASRGHAFVFRLRADHPGGDRGPRRGARPQPPGEGPHRLGRARRDRRRRSTS